MNDDQFFCSIYFKFFCCSNVKNEQCLSTCATTATVLMRIDLGRRNNFENASFLLDFQRNSIRTTQPFLRISPNSIRKMQYPCVLLLVVAVVWRFPRFASRCTSSGLGKPMPRDSGKPHSLIDHSPVIMVIVTQE
jgi:hypothetical protein